jgi:mercuric ion binding protein
MRTLLFALGIQLFAGYAWAAERTATYSVPGMTCALCPTTVETAIGQLEGVKSVEADFETKSAIAVFDDSQTTTDQIAQASANSGYPATLVSVK